MHSIKVVAWARRIMFTSEPVTEIFRRSNGRPCLINVIFEIALSCAFDSGQKRIGAEVIRQCRPDLSATPELVGGTIEKERLVADLEATLVGMIDFVSTIADRLPQV